MADDPMAVKDELRRGLPEVPVSLVEAIRAGRSDFLQAGGPQAYFGRPAEASAAEGQQTFTILASLLVEAIEGSAL
jgi:creatinine amidohydrolase